VLAGWAASPARFREDANAEEDLALGGYRDRLLVELAQNAADAAVRAGVPGVLRLSIVDGELRAANTGEPLTPAGVRSLATLRASAKGSEATGRFGVGFAAVVAVSDEPAVLSRTGGVRFSAGRTREAVAGLPALAGELARRDGQVPALRLPWPAEGEPPEGFDTEVRLPLRAGVEVTGLLSGLTAELLLALPGLARIELPDRTLSIVDVDRSTVELGDGPASRRWRVLRRTGEIPAELLADRPVEERERPQWTITWAVPVGPRGQPEPLAGRQVVHAPTPSDEPLSVPARLIASFPLDPARRHVPPGPLTSMLTDEAAKAYAQLVAGLPADPALLALVPSGGLAAAHLDANLSAAILAELRTTPWLPPDRAAPGDATVVDAASPELVAVLEDVLPGLLPASWSGRGTAAALNALNVRRLSTVDIVEVLSGVDRPPAWWQRLYAALEYGDREALSGLPVPLADGRTVTGPRGVLLPVSGLPPTGLDVLGLRVAHPEAAHPLLERLGAVPATPQGVLADGRVRAAVEGSYDEDDPEPIAEAVLALVAAADLEPGALPWLSELALPTEAGEWVPAGELLLPDSLLARVIDPDSPFELLDPEFAAGHGAAQLRAVGVLGTFAVLRVSDVDILDGDHELDDEDAYYASIADRVPPQDVPPRLAELVAVRDLELVAADRWPQALQLLATIPAIQEPATAVLADGTRVEVPSYAAWWLAHHPVLDGHRPIDLRAPAAHRLAGLYDPAPYGPEILALTGCLSTVDQILADPELAAELLDRLGDPARTADPLLLRDIYGALALALDGFDLPPPPTVRVAPDRVLPAADCVLLDLPYLLPLLGNRVVAPSGGQPGPVADLLNLPFASEVVSAPAGPDTEPVRAEPWSAVPGAVLAAQRCDAGVPDATVAWHDNLRVAGRAVAWWPAAGTDHLDLTAGAPALGRALAWRLDRWPHRAAAAEALDPAADPTTLRAEDAAG
jgi:hypothetical protein